MVSLPVTTDDQKYVNIVDQVQQNDINKFNFFFNRWKYVFVKHGFTIDPFGNISA